jgi:Ca2+-dependent lipid-binding protein
MLNCKCYAGKGSSPEWNENFVFTVSDQATDLVIKLMDSDSGTADDFVGEATYAHLSIHVCNSAITVTSKFSVSVQKASAMKLLSYFWHVMLWTKRT